MRPPGNQTWDLWITSPVCLYLNCFANATYLREKENAPSWESNLGPVDNKSSAFTTLLWELTWSDRAFLHRPFFHTFIKLERYQICFLFLLNSIYSFRKVEFNVKKLTCFKRIFMIKCTTARLITASPFQPCIIYVKGLPRSELFIHTDFSFHILYPLLESLQCLIGTSI